MANATAYVLEVNPNLPHRLQRMDELANNLWYSWDRPTRALFARLHPQLWDAIGHSPKAMLKRIDEKRLVDAAEDPVFLSAFNRVLSAFDTYKWEPVRRNGSEWLQQNDLVAYFCAEFGFHESLPIYSGGLGILAGDHCKAASDMRLPFIGVGLLYRQGYFRQTIDGEGNQDPEYIDSDFDDLPISPVLTAEGAELHVQVPMPGRDVDVKVWQVHVGHVTIYLLGTDLESNSEHDRDIAHRLYGGDRGTRIEQEIVLGVGGVRALAAMGHKPTVWHINEGHAAFLMLERIRELMGQGLDFSAALEAVAVNVVFTTHTAVPAGHDHFNEGMLLSYFDSYCKDLQLDHQQLLALGRSNDDTGADFNMTTLAIHASRHHNGVSRIHGHVTSEMLQGLWPQIPAEDNPIAYVTNGVHVPTFLAPEWVDIFDRFLGFGWATQLHDKKMWGRLDAMPDHVFWSTRQHLKAQMLHLVNHRIRLQHLRNQGSESQLDRLLRLVNPDEPDVLTIGFGRRFATYKRATLLFQDLDRLHKIVTGSERQVLFIFAGKAHPADVPGQDLIRTITRVSRMPEFEGHIMLVEGYDLRLARRLVSGCDVWLNNPVYPLEASGTSGMKAGLNGVLNLSVLDGWWGEGYDGENGWAIKPASSRLDDRRRDWEESQAMYELLQDHIVPLYYERRSGVSHEWVKKSKRSIATLLPNYSAARMVSEYVANFYLSASQMGHRYAENNFEQAKNIAQWKSRIRAAWSGVHLQRLDTPPQRIRYGQSIVLEVAANLNGLAPADVVMELVLSRGVHDESETRRSYVFSADGSLTPSGEHRFVLELAPDLCGKLNHRIRCFPAHELLTHPFELGLMCWA